MSDTHDLFNASPIFMGQAPGLEANSLDLFRAIKQNILQEKVHSLAKILQISLGTSKSLTILNGIFF